MVFCTGCGRSLRFKPLVPVLCPVCTFPLVPPDGWAVALVFLRIVGLEGVFVSSGGLVMSPVPVGEQPASANTVEAISASSWIFIHPPQMQTRICHREVAIGSHAGQPPPVRPRPESTKNPDRIASG